MEELTTIAKLLGEDNEKRLKEEITNLLIRRVEMDLEEKYKYEYILAFDDLYEEVKEQMEKEFKGLLASKYREQMNAKLNEMFGK